MKKSLPIGYDNFKQLIDEGLYYVDKTLMIQDILDNKGSVNLFTRPRRFGKTLMLSMLRYYFEKEHDFDGNLLDNSGLFTGMNIMEAGERYTSEMGKYPVINLSLKSAKQPTYELAYAMLIRRIAEEYKRHAYIMDGIRNESDRKRYALIMNESANMQDYVDAIAFLSQVLSRAYGEKVIILIDEYDVPLENAYFKGFYEEMIDFIRSLFESALKTNECLKFSVITGCLRISKESIFTGLNNLNIISILNQHFSQYFGFVQKEVDDMLQYYDIEEKKQELKEWYDGYLFGEAEVYNPWSVINYAIDVRNHKKIYPKPYWSNTSSNSIIRKLVERADYATRQEIESLIEKDTIEKPIHEDITYKEIYKSQDNLWNFLFFTGYLKKMKERFDEDTIYLTLAIPNAEVRYIYRHTILEWFEEKVGQTDLTPLYHAVLEGDSKIFSQLVSEQLSDTISFFDYAESYYHGFLNGLLKGCKGYITLSNRESGNGRPDIIIKTPSVRGMAIIIEIKIVKDFEKMEEGCDMALTQIEEQNYEASLYKEGYRKFIKYGVCFYRKECLVKKGSGVN